MLVIKAESNCSLPLDRGISFCLPSLLHPLKKYKPSINPGRYTTASKDDSVAAIQFEHSGAAGLMKLIPDLIISIQTLQKKYFIKANQFGTIADPVPIARSNIALEAYQNAR